MLNLITFLKKKNVNIVPKFNLALDKIRFIDSSLDKINDFNEINDKGPGLFFVYIVSLF